MVCKSNQNDVVDVDVTKCLDIMLKTIRTNEIKPAEVFAREVANLSWPAKVIYIISR